MSEQLRTCKECGNTYPISDYHMCKGKPRRVCKHCVSAKFKKRYNTDKEFHDRIVANAKKHHIEHREEHLQQMHSRHAERYATDETYRTSWNRRRKTRYASDADYREKVLSLNHNKRVCMGSDGIISANDWQERLVYFNNTCAYCGAATKLDRDHVMPLSKGGHNVIENLVPACPTCNRSKGARNTQEWYRAQQFYSRERENKILEVIQNETVHSN